LLREAEALAEALDDPRRLGRISIFLSTYFFGIGMYEQGIASCQRALALATSVGDGILHALANQYLGFLYQAQGDYRQTMDCRVST
jgi:tetratricopeptide (TPR) repeat protein